MKKTEFVSLLCLLLAQSANADVSQTKSDEVIVTAYRVHENIKNIPANIQVIHRDEIKKINAVSIPQVLTQLGGLNVRGVTLGQFNQGAIVDIGGYGPSAVSNTLILVNGQRISPIDSSAAPWEIIPVNSVDRIEIIKGGAGVLYGDRAVGGVINIVTFDGATNVNQASVTYGSFNTKRADAIFQNRYNDTLIKLSANSTDSDGWRQNTQIEQYAIDARVTQFFSSGSLYLNAFGNYNKNGVPGAVLGAVNRGDSNNVKCDIYSCFLGAFNRYINSGYSIGGVNDFTDDVRLEADLSYRKTSSEFYKNGDNQADPLTYWTRLYNPPNYFAYNADYTRNRLDFSPRLKINLNEAGNLLLGFDYAYSKGATNEEFKYSIPSSTADSSANLKDHSIYGNHSFSIKKDLDLSFGFRRQTQNINATDYDGYANSKSSKTTSANAWSIALNTRLSDSERLYIKLGQSFRFPNIDEFWGYSSDGRVFFGGIIKPQTDQSIETGIEFKIGNTLLNGSVFRTITEDGIRYSLVSNKNINDPYKVLRQGLYISTNSEISEKISFRTNITLQNAKYHEGPNENKSFDLVPKLLANAVLNYNLPNDYSLSLITNYVGSQYYEGANDLQAYKKMPSFVVTDLVASKRYENWDLSVMVKNIANEKYSTYGGYQDKGSNLFYKGYYYYPSDPRAIFATLRYNF